MRSSFEDVEHGELREILILVREESQRDLKKAVRFLGAIWVHLKAALPYQREPNWGRELDIQPKMAHPEPGDLSALEDDLIETVKQANAHGIPITLKPRFLEQARALWKVRPYICAWCGEEIQGGANMQNTAGVRAWAHQGACSEAIEKAGGQRELSSPDLKKLR